MDEVSGPIIAIALVLCAVFIPTAFISGLTGQFYRQFALTIAISHGHLGVQLADAVAGARPRCCCKPHGTPPGSPARASSIALFGWVFRPFNRFFERASERYAAASAQSCCAAPALALVVYAGLLGLTWLGFAQVPTGFVPTQDKQYLIAFAQLPDAASLDRTEEVIRRMGDIIARASGRRDAVAFPGLSINGFSNAPNAGIVFVTLDAVRRSATGKALSAGAIAGSAATSSSARSRMRSSRLPAAAGAWASARSAASRCRSRIAAASATTSCTRRRRTSLAKARPDARPRQACSPASRSTCRSSTRTSIA